jgi:hypothetical protein
MKGKSNQSGVQTGLNHKEGFAAHKSGPKEAKKTQRPMVDGGPARSKNR